MNSEADDNKLLLLIPSRNAGMASFSLLIKELEGRNSLGVKQSQLFKEDNFIRV